MVKRQLKMLMKTLEDARETGVVGFLRDAIKGPFDCRLNECHERKCARLPEGESNKGQRRGSRK